MDNDIETLTFGAGERLKHTASIEEAERTSRTRRRVASMLVSTSSKRDEEEAAAAVAMVKKAEAAAAEKAAAEKAKQKAPKKRVAATEDPDQIYEIERIVDVRWSGGKREYLIAWKGYTDKYNTWEPEESFVSSLPLQPWLGVKPVMPSANSHRPRANTKSDGGGGGGTQKRKRGRPPIQNARAGTTTSSSSSSSLHSGPPEAVSLALPAAGNATTAGAGAAAAAGGARSAASSGRLPLPPPPRNNAGARRGPAIINNSSSKNKNTASSSGSSGSGNPSLAGKAISAVTLGGKSYSGGQARAVDVLKNLQELDHRSIHERLLRRSIAEALVRAGIWSHHRTQKKASNAAATTADSNAAALSRPGVVNSMSVGESASGGTGAGRSSTTTTTSGSGSISTGASSETGTNDSSTSGSCTSGSNGSAGEGCAEQPITVDDTGGSSDMEVGNAWDEVGGPLWTLRTHAVGLFVRLKVECSYCIAQVLDIFEDKRESYELGDVRTSLFLIVAFDQDKTLARLSYISDGLEISTEEYAVWRSKLDQHQLLMTKPSPAGLQGNLAKLLCSVQTFQSAALAAQQGNNSAPSSSVATKATAADDARTFSESSGASANDPSSNTDAATTASVDGGGASSAPGIAEPNFPPARAPAFAERAAPPPPPPTAVAATAPAVGEPSNADAPSTERAPNPIPNPISLPTAAAAPPPRLSGAGN